MDHNPDSNVDYVARAAALMKKAARTGALVIVPLAAAVSANHASAAVILPISPADCAGPSCGVSQTGEAGGLIGFSVGASTSGQIFLSGGDEGSLGYRYEWQGPLQLNSAGTNCAGVGAPCIVPELEFAYQFSAGNGTLNSGQQGQPLGTYLQILPGYTISLQADGVSLFSVTDTSLDQGGLSRFVSGVVDFAAPDDLNAKIAALAASGSGANVDFSLLFNTNWAVAGSSCDHGFCTDQTGFVSAVNASLTGVASEQTAATPEPGSIGLILLGLIAMAAGFARRWFRRPA